MEERREQIIDAHSFSAAEQEAVHQRIRELIDEHNVIGDELRRLVSEEGSLVAKDNVEDADYVRIDEINKREIEIINKQTEIIDEMSRLRKTIHP